MTRGKVALNTLTGADIKDSSLGEVPPAATADKATSVGSLSEDELLAADATPACHDTTRWGAAATVAHDARTSTKRVRGPSGPRTVTPDVVEC